jgi:hypothetical protein
MSTLNITIPDSVRSRLERCAREGVSMDDFVASVLSQRVAVADADSYVRGRASRGSAESLIQLLDKAPDNEPEPGDRIIG